MTCCAVYGQLSCLFLSPALSLFVVFFFNDTATAEIYTLSLHDALPIWARASARPDPMKVAGSPRSRVRLNSCKSDRKSTRLNSSHTVISYAVFCLKKKIEIIELIMHVLGTHSSKLNLHLKRQRTGDTDE